MVNEIIKKEETLYERLKKEKRPIIIYGMGNGADKIFDICDNKSIRISGIFASDEFVRGHSFRGHKVKTYAEINEEYPDAVILLAFAVFRDDLMQKIESIASEHTLLVPDVPLFGKGLFDSDFVAANIDNIRRAYDLFADEKSKSVFLDVINFRLSGIPKILRRCETDRAELFENILSLGSCEDYLDLGAYDGDTIAEFLNYTNGKYSTVTAFEPDRKNMKKLTKQFGSLERCVLLPYASWEKDCMMKFSGTGGRMSCIDEDGTEIEAKAVDSLNKKFSYIKMDVEGAEYETLSGIRNTICKYKPKLAVSAYHRVGDIFTLPLYISQLNSDYKIYIRHHKYLPSWETNIYAV